MHNRSSPASSIRARQQSAASTSLERTGAHSTSSTRSIERGPKRQAAGAARRGALGCRIQYASKKQTSRTRERARQRGENHRQGGRNHRGRLRSYAQGRVTTEEEQRQACAEEQGALAAPTEKSSEEIARGLALTAGLPAN